MHSQNPGRLHGHRLCRTALAVEADAPSNDMQLLPNLASSSAGLGPAPGALPFLRRGLMGGISQPSPSSLNEIMKVEELMGKTPEEVSDIWLAYHNVEDASKQRVGSVMTGQEYKEFRKRAKERWEQRTYWVKRGAIAYGSSDV